MDPQPPYLSVVVTSRNDDHGGDPLKRLQAFINSFDAQCRETGLDAEVIVVEWNPPTDRPRLASLLRFPEPRVCTYRFIEVPPELHGTLSFSDVLPLFQMIAKNVGIRRARGRFVLATNIDILFSNELVAFLASGGLEPGVIYRVDRHDIEPTFPIDAPLDRQMAFCAEHQLRLHTKFGSFPVDASGRVVPAADDIVAGPLIELGKGWHVCEGSAAGGFYRWATDRATVHLDTDADPSLAGRRTALDIEVEPNPYDPLSWVELEVVDDRGTPLARNQIVRRQVLRVVLNPPVPRTITLRVTAMPRDARSRLAIFERRDAMQYRVRSISLRPYVPEVERLPFVYPSAGWRTMPGVRLADTQPPDGLAVVTDSRRWSYCLEYGPLRAPCTGTFSFSLHCETIEGRVSFGVLARDRRAWLPLRRTNMITSEGDVIEVSVELTAGDVCSLMIDNDPPGGDGASRCVVKTLRGSCDIAAMLAIPASALRWPAVLRDLRWFWAESRRSQGTP